MKKHLVSILLLCLAAMVFAQKNTGRVMISESDLEFERLNDKEVKITGFKDSNNFNGKVIEIPSKIQGLPVTTIGKEAFSYRGSNKSGLWIPDSVKNIENRAFEGSHFSSIRLPEGLTYIGNRTFSNCEAKSINIPSSVKKIYGSAFRNCSIESISIPSGCTINGGGGEDTSAFHRCTKLKTVTFPSGTVYFDAEPLTSTYFYAYSNEGIFTECDAIENVTIPSGFEAAYISNGDSKEYTLADYFSGQGIKQNFNLEDKLKKTKVRSNTAVDNDKYLAAYNQAFKSGDYTRAANLAQQFINNYHGTDYKWYDRRDDAKEKPYLDAYNKAFASKDYAKAMQTAKEFIEKQLYIHSSDWTKRYNDAAEKPYLDDYDKAIASKDYTTAMQAAKQFKEKYPNINSNDWTIRYNNAAEKPYLDDYDKAIASKDYEAAMQAAKQFKEKNPNINSNDWTIRYNNAAEKPYLDDYDKAIASEDYTAAMQAVNQFKEKYPNINSYGWTLRYIYIVEKPYLDKFLEAYSSKDWQKAKSIANEFNGEISSDSSLSSIKSKWDNYEYKADCQILLPAYIEKLEKKGTYTQLDSKLQFAIPLTEDEYKNSEFKLRDSEGKLLPPLSSTDFLKKVKEISGKNYTINSSYRPPYLCRTLTSKENDALKEAVKIFMDEALKYGEMDYDGSKLRFKIPLTTFAYIDNYFIVKDSAGNVYSLYRDCFIAFVKEIYGAEYETLGRYSVYDLYRDATDKEKEEFHKPRRAAVKSFMDEALKTGKIEKNGSNFVFKVYLSSDTYNSWNETFSFKDSAGSLYTISKRDFLTYIKEIYGTEYDLNYSYLSRKASAEEISAYYQSRKDAVKLFLDESLKNGKVEKNGANFVFKVYLTSETFNYRNDIFNLKDSAGNIYSLSKDEFFSYAKVNNASDYNLYGSSNSSYLYRNATEKEIAAYHQLRKDAVKLFMDDASKTGTVENDGSGILFKIALDSASYKNGSFNLKDSTSNPLSLNKDDFLNYAKEVYGMDYKLSTDSRNPYLYRNATEKEIAAYHQLRKDAVKLFMDDANKTGTVENDGSGILFKIALDSASYKNGSFNLKDSTSNPLSLNKDDFLNYAKEVYGIEYKLSTDSRNPYLYRDATDKETAAFHQTRKDAVKLFMDDANKTGTVENDGSGILFKIALDSASYKNGSFNLKDSTSNPLTLNKDDFLNYAKEVYGMDYKLSTDSRNPYLYRDATDKETAAFHQTRKDTVKLFMDDASKTGTVENHGSSILFKIALDSASYKNSSFNLKDSTSNPLSLNKDDFLNYAKEIYGIEYKLSTDSRNPYLYRDATDKETAAFHQTRKDAVKLFMDDANKTGTVENDGSGILFKIALDSASYKNGSFNLKDSTSNPLTLNKDDFLNYAKETYGMEYKLSTDSRNPYLYRDATDKETSAYHQLRKDAVKLFMDNAAKKGIVENDGSSILFKITLDSASYKKGSFNLMDSASNMLSLSKEDFLNYAKEVYGVDYKLSTDSRNPYLYRDATDKDIASYSQRKKDAVKLYMDEAVKAATITKSGSNILFKLLLDSATYRNGTFNLKDSNGNSLSINKDEFINLANEIYGLEYKLDENNRNECLYRSVTDKEAAEFHKARKEAVKLFMDAAIKNGTVEKDGANILFKIQLDSNSYKNGTFILKDSNGNEFSLSSDDFFNYETELYGTDYKLSTDSRNPCLYRNATDKEKSEFHRPRKEAVKAYIGEAEKTKRVELNGQNLLSRIYLDSSTYDRYSSKFTIMDHSGNELSLDKTDFLNYLNEICGTEYKVDGGSTTCMLYRNASTEEKRLYAFKNEMFHTNLAYQNKDGEWECIAEFSETEEGAVINSFKAKKSEFEKRGLKTKDVITQIELVDSDGNSSFVSVDELDEIPAPASLIFTVKRGSGKKLKELIIEVPVEWNESDIKNESNLSFVKVNDVPNMQNAQNITSKSFETDAPKLTEQKSKTTGDNDMALTFGILKPISAENLFDNSTFGLSVAWEGGNNQTIFNVMQGDFFFNEGTKIYLGYDLGVNIGPVFGLYAGGGVGVGLSGDSLSSEPDDYTFGWKANAGIRLVMKKFVCRFDASYISFYGFCAGAFVGFAW